ncbi:MAG: hypothetical protein H7X93_05540 [Sphingomonadaceae bacterium]|nr:hypothetical protein [Sphingomonadaceae bacterium]
MPDSPLSALLEDAPDFAPVPLARTRYDGWLPARQHMFIAALSAMGTGRTFISRPTACQ